MTELRKNFYEEVIDQMMIEEVAGLDNDIKETLSGLDTKQKRLAILSILDNNRDLFLRIRKLITDSKVGKTEYITQVVTMLREYVKVGEVEKKTLGEVMTPISLVEEMLDKLPADVWSNPNLKWLDSCNGVGIFPSVVVKRLMDGLVDFEANEELRYKHIVENMLYVGELQPKNMFLFLCSFDPKDEYDMNIYTGSFLDEAFDNHMKDVWGIEKFDVIVGNPPYQDFQNATGKRGGGNSLWDKFINKYLDVLVDNGYLVAVHPSGWRNIDGKLKYIQNRLKSKTIEYLEIHNANDGNKVFGAATRYDWYCLKNTEINDSFTLVKCEDGTFENVKISHLEFIPNGMFAKIDSLFAKEGDEIVHLLNSRSAYGSDKRHMFKIQTDTHIYPCIQNVNVKNKPSCIWYSNTNKNGHFGLTKVIFGVQVSGVMIDSDGSLGMAQHCSAIVDSTENLDCISKAMRSAEFIKLSMNCDTGGNRDRYNRKVIAQFRKDFWKEFINEEETVTQEADTNAASIQD
jgi:hypothetical protein